MLVTAVEEAPVVAAAVTAAPPLWPILAGAATIGLATVAVVALVKGTTNSGRQKSSSKSGSSGTQARNKSTTQNQSTGKNQSSSEKSSGGSSAATSGAPGPPGPPKKPKSNSQGCKSKSKRDQLQAEWKDKLKKMRKAITERTLFDGLNGGSYEQLQDMISPSGGDVEINHCPPKSAYPVSKNDRDKAQKKWPAFVMSREHHRIFFSTNQEQYRDILADLLADGNFSGALEVEMRALKDLGLLELYLRGILEMLLFCLESKLISEDELESLITFIISLITEDAVYGELDEFNYRQ